MIKILHQSCSDESAPTRIGIHTQRSKHGAFWDFLCHYFPPSKLALWLIITPHLVHSAYANPEQPASPPAADVLADFIRCNIIIWCLQPVLVSQPLHVKHISVFHQPFYQQMILWVIWFFLVVFCTFHSWSAAPQSIVSVFVYRFMQKESTALQIRRPSFFSFTINQ